MFSFSNKIIPKIPISTPQSSTTTLLLPGVGASKKFIWETCNSVRTRTRSGAGVVDDEIPDFASHFVSSHPWDLKIHHKRHKLKQSSKVNSFEGITSIRREMRKGESNYKLQVPTAIASQQQKGTGGRRSSSQYWKCKNPGGIQGCNDQTWIFSNLSLVKSVCGLTMKVTFLRPHLPPSSSTSFLIRFCLGLETYFTNSTFSPRNPWNCSTILELSSRKKAGWNLWITLHPLNGKRWDSDKNVKVLIGDSN